MENIYEVDFNEKYGSWIILKMFNPISGEVVLSGFKSEREAVMAKELIEYLEGK